MNANTTENSRKMLVVVHTPFRLEVRGQRSEVTNHKDIFGSGETVSNYLGERVGSRRCVVTGTGSGQRGQGHAI